MVEMEFSQSTLLETIYSFSFEIPEINRAVLESGEKEGKNMAKFGKPAFFSERLMSLNISLKFFLLS